LTVLQGDVDHVAVGVELRHLDPVAHADQVVAGQLDARHQAEQRVAEHQQQHRRSRAEPTEDEERVAPDQRRDHHDGRQDVDDEHDRLQVALDGPRGRLRRAGVHIAERVEEGADRARDHQHHGSCDEALREGRDAVGQQRHEGEPGADDEEWHRPGETVEEAPGVQRLVPLHAGAATEAAERAHQVAARHDERAPPGRWCVAGRLPRERPRT
jgi:hypothetical protein